MKIKKETITYVDDDIEFDGLKLLSTEEYDKYKDNIKRVDFWWWLSSVGYYGSRAFNVYYDDNVYSDNVNSKFGSVRPALILKTNTLSIGGKFKFYGYSWTVISEKFALCDQAFCRMAFRENWNTGDTNSYEVSDIKKYLDEQWENIKNEDYKIGDRIKYNGKNYVITSNRINAE